MGTLSFDFKADMDDIFLDSGFEEDITYTPDGESALSIKAIVDRDRLDETVEGASRLNIYKYQIIISKTDVPNAVSEGDEVVITVGDSTETLRVAGILEDDLGAYRLGLR